jgi:uncharacterized RDD family membrane protein YckC
MAITQLPIASLFQFAIVTVVALALALILATQLAESLVRFRARRLPEHLAGRFLEEWLGEIRSMTSRLRKLMFAVAISVMRNRTLLDAEAGQPETSAPAVLSIEDVRVYSAFGSRFGALLIDFFLLWLTGEFLAFALRGRLEPAAIALASTTLWFLIEIWFILTLGGTPGKLAMQLRIVAFGGEPLNYRHVLLRLLPNYGFSVLPYAISLWAIHQAGVSLGTPPSAEQQRLMIAATPWWFTTYYIVCRLTWVIADTVVFFQSTERRALHDLIAGTVVVVKVPHVADSTSA